MQCILSKTQQQRQAAIRELVLTCAHCSFDAVARIEGAAYAIGESVRLSVCVVEAVLT